MNILQWWKDHGTKIIGTLVTVISGALALSIIPAQYVKLAEGFLALLGGTAVKRGFTNSANPPSA